MSRGTVKGQGNYEIIASWDVVGIQFPKNSNPRVGIESKAARKRERTDIKNAKKIKIPMKK